MNDEQLQDAYDTAFWNAQQAAEHVTPYQGNKKLRDALTALEPLAAEMRSKGLLP